MTDKGFTIRTTVPQAPMEVYRAIVDPRRWWGKDIEGEADRLGAEWTYRYQDLHVSRQRTTVLEPVRRIVWDVIDADISFLQDRHEWKGTALVFDLAPNSTGTAITFTHVGLLPGAECYEICTTSWSNLIMESLAKLLTGGAGRPDEVLAPV